MLAYCSRLQYDHHRAISVLAILTQWAYRLHCQTSDEELPLEQDKWDELFERPEGDFQQDERFRIRWARHGGLAAVSVDYLDRFTRHRLWRYSFSLTETPSAVAITTFVRVEDLSGGRRTPVAALQPEVVTEIIDKLGPPPFGGKLSLTGMPRFLEEIRNPKRDYAIVLISSRKNQGSLARPMVNPDDVRRTLAGLARVYQVPPEHNWEISAILGNDWTVFNGSIRVFFPRDPHYQSEGNIPSKILLPGDCYDQIRRGHKIDEHLLYLTYSEMALKLREYAHSPAGVQAAVLHDAIESLRERLQRPTSADPTEAERKNRENDLMQMLELFERENLSLTRSAEEAQSALKSAEETLAQRAEEIEELRKLLRARPGKANEPEPIAETTPRRLVDIPEMIQKKFPDRVVFTRRAMKSMEDSPYNEVPHVWEATCLLAETYWRALQPNAVPTDLVAAARQIHWDYAPHLAANTSGLYEGYNARYKNRDADLSRHLKRGSSRNPSRCFRMHFEMVDNQIVIHHAGRHLDNSKS